MARRIQGGDAATFQFTVYGADGVTKLTGIAGALIGEVTIDTAGGAIIDAGIALTIAEQAGAPGDYYATFPVPAGAQVGRSYFATVRYPANGYDVQETFEVRETDEASLANKMLGVSY